MAWVDFLGPARDDARTLRFTDNLQPAPTGPRVMPKIEGTKILGSGFEAQLLGAHAEITGSHERLGIEAVLKLMLATALLARSALLVHSVALSEGQGCAVFLGESGAGKSTLGQLGASGGLRRLADELVVLDAEGWAHGTPWNIGLSEAAQVRLLGTLGWSERCRLEPVAATDFLPLLLSNTLLADDRPATRGTVFQLATGLLKAHQPERFFFPPSAAAAPFLRSTLLSKAARPPRPTAG